MEKIVNSFPKSTLFMAVARGQVSTEPSEIKRYIGVGTCNVLAVNPTKAEMKSLMGFEPQEEPVYTGTQEIDGKNVPFVRLTFILKTVAEKCSGIDTTVMLTYFIRNQYRKGNNTGKYQVIDEFGRDAWGDEAVIKAKQQIMYKNGAANVTTNYRPAYVGEVDVTEFVKALLNIPNPANYVNGSWVMKPATETKDSECRLEDIAKYFKGDISEIKEILTFQVDNKIKVLFGIRITDDGKEYQDIYPHVLRNNVKSYESLQKEIEDRKANNGLANRYYEFCDLKEYKVEPTNFDEAPAEVNNDPLAQAADMAETPWG